ncbi:hypothetical protein [Sinorhizobium glycinis]|uniref:hypothetical protein n=1 Tax=Sinorhizobium glycinis TaxID=1472378 RepID=UPI0012E7A9BD|nr:hypothetical protein [Sinorhizobium glycinis]
MTHGVLLEEQRFARSGLPPQEAVAKPVNGPVFGVRNQNMGMRADEFKGAFMLVFSLQTS